VPHKKSSTCFFTSILELPGKQQHQVDFQITDAGTLELIENRVMSAKRKLAGSRGRHFGKFHDAMATMRNAEGIAMNLIISRQVATGPSKPSILTSLMRQWRAFAKTTEWTSKRKRRSSRTNLRSSLSDGRRLTPWMSVSRTGLRGLKVV
jgi:hypothetical protein